LTYREHKRFGVSKFDGNQWLYTRRLLFLSILNHVAMAKSQDARKETKKKPTKTLKEKRAEKQAKKASKN
jgi:hypothetical protein